ncbi:MAG: DUF4149 domain-containing protein [Candidatus Binatia bacterium]
MSWVVLFLHVLALGVWTGAVVFFSFAVAPSLFANLPVEQAGAVVALIFPTYYVVGYACGAILVGSALALRGWSRPGGGLWLVAAGLAAVALALSLYAGLVVHPAASALRPQLRHPDTPPAVQAEFDDLHRLAVELNVGVLLALLASNGLLVAQLASGVSARRRPARRTSDLQW